MSEQTLEQLHASMFHAEKELERGRKELAKVQNRVKKLYEVYERERDEYLKVKLANPTPQDLEDILEPNGGQFIYDLRKQFLADLGLGDSGCYSADLNQSLVRVTLWHDGRTNEKVIEGLRTVLPYIKPQPKGENKGYKAFDIFENSLSADGVYYLYIDDVNDKYRLGKLTYGRQTNKNFKTLEELIEYTSKHHYYYDEDYD